MTVFAVLLFLPTLTPELPAWFYKIIPTEKVHLGLDLQGGMHLILEVQAEKAVESYVERVKNNLRDDLRDKAVPVGKLEREKSNQIVLEVSGEKGKWEKILSQRYGFMQELSSTALDKGIWRVVLVLDSRQAEQIRKGAIDQALETIRNRIDQFGVAEPEITLQGTDRILIQLPGIKDPQRAIDLIGRTALLEFKLVDEEGNLDEALKGNAPEGSIIFYQRYVDPKTGGVKKTPFLLKEKTLMTGEVLKDARVTIDTQFNEPYVALEFDDIGAKLFEQITGANVKKRLAIILDDNVYSAPVIQERIAGGRAQITGRFDMKEAGDLAIVLRAGALPAPVKILEQRSVGPSLGQDSIRKGIISTLISAAMVALFMIFYYRVSGVIADIALILNILFVMGTLAIFRATLTLPGIAGLVLSIGMAVDANILIHERIKEELRWGKTVRAAIDEGYRRAFVTILDSNLTTLFAALFLYQFGTGPVKGFAVTLSIGTSCKYFYSGLCDQVGFRFPHPEGKGQKVEHLIPCASSDEQTGQRIF